MLLLQDCHGSLPSEGPRRSEQNTVALAVKRHSQGAVESTIGTTAALRAVFVRLELLCVVEIIVVRLGPGGQVVLPTLALHGEELLGHATTTAGPEGLGDPDLPPGGAGVQPPLLRDSWTGKDGVRTGWVM